MATTETEDQWCDRMWAQATKEAETAAEEARKLGKVRCSECHMYVKPGVAHYPGNDPEDGAAHMHDAGEGYDECTECGKRFNAKPTDKRPVCPDCK